MLLSAADEEKRAEKIILYCFSALLAALFIGISWEMGAWVGVMMFGVIGVTFIGFLFNYR